MSKNSPYDDKAYITNPFTLGVESIKTLYRKAHSIFWLMLIISLVIFINNSRNNRNIQNTGTAETIDPNLITNEMAVSILVIALFVSLLIVALLNVFIGIGAYTASQLSRDKKVTFKEAFSATMSNFWRLLAVNIITGVRLLGWTLLLVVPGFVMAVRYSLAPVIAFREPHLHAGEVVTRSAHITKGAWFDVFAGRVLLNFVTLGSINQVVNVATQYKLYKQLRNIKDKGLAKPKTHWLSYVTLAIFLAGIVLAAFTFHSLYVLAAESQAL